jgi:phage nucleotide-binding protein
MSEPLLIDDEIEITLPVETPAPTPETPTAKVKTDKILDAIMERIAPAAVNTPTLKVLIYGEPGVGKTTFAATAPAPLVIDVERGSRALLNTGNPVDVLEFRSIEQVEATIQYLKSGHEKFAKYETIVLDSITEMQARLIDQQLRTLGAGAPVYKADWGVYGENTQRLRMLVSSFRDIEKNLICTAHAKMDKDDQTGLNMWRPALTPGLAKTVAGIFDIVGYLRINAKGERVLRVQPSKTVLAKSRLALPEEINSPSWASINK